MVFIDLPAITPIPKENVYPALLSPANAVSYQGHFICFVAAHATRSLIVLNAKPGQVGTTYVKTSFGARYAAMLQKIGRCKWNFSRRNHTYYQLWDYIVKRVPYRVIIMSSDT